MIGTILQFVQTVANAQAKDNARIKQIHAERDAKKLSRLNGGPGTIGNLIEKTPMQDYSIDKNPIDFSKISSSIIDNRPSGIDKYKTIGKPDTEFFNKAQDDYANLGNLAKERAALPANALKSNTVSNYTTPNKLPDTPTYTTPQYPSNQGNQLGFVKQYAPVNLDAAPRTNYVEKLPNQQAAPKKSGMDGSGAASGLMKGFDIWMGFVDKYNAKKAKKDDKPVYQFQSNFGKNR